MATCRLRVIGLLASLLLAPGVLIAQSVKNKTDPGLASRLAFNASVLLPTNRELEARLEAVRDYMKVQRWREVTQALQDILDYPEDCFLSAPPGPDGAPRWVSARFEASRLLGSLPADARLMYEVLAGGKASALLKEARTTSDWHKLALITQRYLHTKAGGEALDLLGSHHLDRGRYLPAAICFERLLQRADPPPALSLFKASLAFHRNGEAARAADAWNKLAETQPDGILQDGQRVGLQDLKALLERPFHRQPITVAAGDWAVFRGDATRARLGDTAKRGDTAKLGNSARLGVAKDARLALEGKLWHEPALHGVYGRSWLANAVQMLEQRGHSLLPGAFPLAVAGRVVFRTHYGLCAIHSGSGDIAWKSENFVGGFDNLPSNSFPQIDNWVSSYLGNAPTAILENTVVGTLSSDGARVYAVEDLVVPPYPNPYQFVSRVPASSAATELTEAINHNKLVAVNLESGRIDWVAGGADSGRDHPLQGCYFLGPPLPLAGKLYVLLEKDMELRLACLEPGRGEPAWSQPLATFKRPLSQEVGRRFWATPLAYHDGILICPSQAGVLVAVDLISNSLLWAYSYQRPSSTPADVKLGNLRPPARPNIRTVIPKLTPQWKASSPVIADGKVIVTAADAAEIHCINLRDGSFVWKADQQSGDLAVAGVYQDKILIVGHEFCRMIRLTDGARVSQVKTGVPTGLGVADGSTYYLPVRHAGRGYQILAVDLERGTASPIATPIATSGNQLLGNLLLCGDQLISQTPNGITAFALSK